MSESNVKPGEKEQLCQVVEYGSRTEILVSKKSLGPKGTFGIVGVAAAVVVLMLQLGAMSERESRDWDTFQVLLNILVVFAGTAQFVEARYSKTLIEVNSMTMSVGARLFGLGWSRTYSMVRVSGLRFCLDVKEEKLKQKREARDRRSEKEAQEVAADSGGTRRITSTADERPIADAPRTMGCPDGAVPDLRRGLVFDYDGGMQIVAAGISGETAQQVIDEIRKRHPGATEQTKH